MCVCVSLCVCMPASGGQLDSVCACVYNIFIYVYVIICIYSTQMRFPHELGCKSVCALIFMSRYAYEAICIFLYASNVSSILCAFYLQYLTLTDATTASPNPLQQGSTLLIPLRAPLDKCPTTLFHQQLTSSAPIWHPSSM